MQLLYSKPKFGIAGSGMHTVCLSLTKMATMPSLKVTWNAIVRNCLSLLGGLIKACLQLYIMCPTVSSYKRLVPGYEAPVCYRWQVATVPPLVRVPASRGMGTRLEIALRRPNG